MKIIYKHGLQNSAIQTAYKHTLALGKVIINFGKIVGYCK